MPVHKDRTENGQEIDTLSDRRLSWSIIRDILYERLFSFRRKDRPTHRRMNEFDFENRILFCSSVLHFAG